MFGNGLDMKGHVDSTFNSPIDGGVRIIRAGSGDYIAKRLNFDYII